VLTGRELLALRKAFCVHLQDIAYSTANLENEGHMLYEMSGNIHQSAHYQLHENFIKITL
jgi:hypothetical protein